MPPPALVPQTLVALSTAVSLDHQYSAADFGKYSVFKAGLIVPSSMRLNSSLLNGSRQSL